MPLILATSFVFAANVALPLGAKLPLLGEPTLATAAAAAYALFYLYLDPGAVGASAAALVWALYAGQAAAAAAYGAGAWKPALALHVLSWVAQFYGHGVHEGRAPALLDNLAQALFMAPM